MNIRDLARSTLFLAYHRTAYMNRQGCEFGYRIHSKRSYRLFDCHKSAQTICIVTLPPSADYRRLLLGITIVYCLVLNKGY